MQARTPPDWQLRLFALAWVAILLLISRFHPGIAPYLWFLALCAWICVFSRRLAEGLFRLMAVVTRPLGWLNTRILLGLLFFVVMTPVGFAMRLFGADPLKRAWQPKAKTYWEPIEPNSHHEATHV